MAPQFKRIKHYGKAGRPSKDAVPTHLEWRVEGTLDANEELIAETQLWKGRFILATNILAPLDTGYEAMLADYKDQQHAERGFRFLKDPWFMVDSM